MFVVLFGEGIGNQMFQYAFYLSLINKYKNNNVMMDICHIRSIAHNGFELDKVFGVDIKQCKINELMNLSNRVPRGVPHQKFWNIIFGVKKRVWGYKEFHILQDDITVFYPEVYQLKSYCFDGVWANLMYYKDNEKLLLCVFFISIVLDFVIGKDTLFRGYIFTLGIAFFFFRDKKSSILNIAIMFFCIIETGFKSDSSIVGALVCFFIIAFFEPILAFFRRNAVKKVASVFIIIALLIYALYLMGIKINITDSNSLWRLQYWKNELKVIIRTYLIGVGFGTAYASDSIFYEINNTAVLMHKNDLFVVTQHSSLVNSFYRLGIVGLIIFTIFFIIFPFYFTANVYKCDSNNKKVLKWIFCSYLYNLVIIVLNPGLESPRFGLGFIIVYGFLMGIIFVNSRIHNFDNLNKKQTSNHIYDSIISEKYM